MKASRRVVHLRQSAGTQTRNATNLFEKKLYTHMTQCNNEASFAPC